MARPSPRPVVRFNAKIDTSVVDEMSWSASSVPTTAMTPITSGSPAATMLPNTSSNAIAVSGVVMSSERWTSFSDCALTWRATSESPVTSVRSTSVRWVNSGDSRLAVFTRSPRSPWSVPMMSAWCPSVLLSGGAFDRVQ